MEGAYYAAFVLKRGPKATSKWQRRHLELRQGSLRYAKDEQAKSLGAFYLSQVAALRQGI
jgi:hypothetical protein